MATDQAVDQEQWQDYKPPPQGDSDWQDYKPAAAAPAPTSFRTGTPSTSEKLTAPIDTEAKNPISRTLSSAGGTVIGALSHPIDTAKGALESLGDVATLGLTPGSPIGESVRTWANPKTRPTWEGIKSVLPEALGQGIGNVALGEAAGAVVPPVVKGIGEIPKSIAERNPVVRGTQAYQKLIAPATSKAIEQMDDVETIRRAMPYLGEQEQLTRVKSGAGAGPKGQKLGVLNYRQNAQMAADRLWNEKIAPIQGSYDAAPIDSGRVANEIRATHDPNAPPNANKAQAVSDLADHYNQPTTIKEALAKVKALNEDRQVAAYEKALPDQQAEMIRADPAIEAKVQAANSLREAVFDSIERHGSPAEAEYVREARKDFGALQQVSKNLANAPVPTPGSFVDKLLNTARVALRPRSATAPVAETLFNDPNKLAAKSSRLFGAADLPTRAAPPLRTTPWAPAAPAPFIAPAAPPQAPPNAAGQVTGIGSVVNPQAVGPRGTAGTRFAPKGLLPGPIAGTPAQQVGTPPPVGFPGRIGTWEGFGLGGPGWEPHPGIPITQAPPPIKPMVPPAEVPRGTAAPPPQATPQATAERLYSEVDEELKNPGISDIRRAHLESVKSLYRDVLMGKYNIPESREAMEQRANAPGQSLGPALERLKSASEDMRLNAEYEKSKARGILPGMEEHVAKQAEGAAKVKGEDLTREANTPKNVDEAAGQLETKSPLFRGTAASPQKEIFAPAPVSKPLAEEYTPEEIEEAKSLLKREVQVTQQSDKPGRYFDESEPGDVRTGSRQIRGGDWRGLGTNRNMMSFLKAYPEYTVTRIKEALERPNAPASERLLSRAAEMVRDEKLRPEEKQAKYQWKPDASRPANAMDLLHALRKPKVE